MSHGKLVAASTITIFLLVKDVAGLHAVHLHKELALVLSRGLVLRLEAAAGAQAVDLVDKDGVGRVEAIHFEEQPHELLTLAAVL